VSYQRIYNDSKENSHSKSIPENYKHFLGQNKQNKNWIAYKGLS